MIFSAAIGKIYVPAKLALICRFFFNSLRDGDFLVTATMVLDPATEKKAGEKIDRDALMARVETEKKLALIKAWEENEKAKAQNRAYKKLSEIKAWEESKRACVEAQLKNIEEAYEKKRAEYGEKMNNKAAEIHRAAEENRAVVEAKLGDDIIKVEERAEKYRITEDTPKRSVWCFGC